jgi:hypothetical protein
MNTQYDTIAVPQKLGGSFKHQGDALSRMIDSASLDPWGRGPLQQLSKGTVLAPLSTGLMKPWRMTLATAISLPAGSGQTTDVNVADPQLFVAGDVIGVVPQATPTVAATSIGTISSITGSVLTLGAYVAHAVADGDIIVVLENDAQTDVGILATNVNLLSPLIDTEPGTILTVAVEGVVVERGEIEEAQVVMNTCFGITMTRLRAFMPFMKIVPPLPGQV